MSQPTSKNDCTRERIRGELRHWDGIDADDERIDGVIDDLIERGQVVEDSEGRLGTPDLGAPAYIRSCVKRRLDGSRGVNRGGER